MNQLRMRVLMVQARGLLLGLLLAVPGACAGLPADEAVRVPALEPGWRVVERVGHGVALSPGQSTWRAIEPNGMLVPGSEVATGGASRLILARAESQIMLGPMARVVLPEVARGDRLEQRDGTVRYRISGAAARPFRLEAAGTQAESADGTFDVDLRPGQQRTVIQVAAGEVRVVSGDGRRGATLHAGEAALAEAVPEQRLAVRQVQGQAFEPVVAAAPGEGRLAEARAPGVSARAAAALAVADAAPLKSPPVIRPASQIGRDGGPVHPEEGGAVAPVEPVIVPARFRLDAVDGDGVAGVSAGAAPVAATGDAGAAEAAADPSRVPIEASDGAGLAGIPPADDVLWTGLDPVFDNLVRGVLEGLPRARRDAPAGYQR